MKTHTSKRNIWLRSIVLLPLIAFSIYGFSDRKEVFKMSEDLQESNSDYTARSISIEVLEDGTYSIDGISANKSTLITVINKLHQDITPEIRNDIMNIHVTSSSEISNEETWFLYNSLLDYGFYRLVTPEQEVVKGKGNTPFAIEQTQQKVIKEDNRQGSIPVLILKQDPLTLTLNGKLTSLENLNEDFKDVTNGKISDLRIEADEIIKMSILETISEILKPNLSKILFRAESGIVADKPFGNTVKTKDLIDKPLLKLTNDVKLVCDNCTLDKGLLKNASVATSNNESIESFNVKIPSNPSVLVKGNTFNKEVLKQIESMNNDDQLMIFNIKTSTKNIEASILINVKTQRKATKEEIEEYNKLVKSYNSQPADKIIIKQKDVVRMQFIYDKMDEEQKMKAEPFPNILPAPPPPIMDTVFTYNRLAKRIISNPDNRKNNIEYLNKIYNEMSSDLKSKVNAPSQIIKEANIVKDPIKKTGFIKIDEIPKPTSKNAINHLKVMNRHGAKFYLDKKEVKFEDAIKSVRKNKNADIESTMNPPIVQITSI